MITDEQLAALDEAFEKSEYDIADFVDDNDRKFWVLANNHMRGLIETIRYQRKLSTELAKESEIFRRERDLRTVTAFEAGLEESKAENAKLRAELKAARDALSHEDTHMHAGGYGKVGNCVACDAVNHIDDSGLLEGK